jgi:outer membrane protein assembly factor BamB
MLGGDAGHSGLNPGETGVPPLVQAWVAPGAGGSGPPVVEGGRVLSLGGAWLYAHEASNGAELWKYNFGQVLGGIGWPAVSGGKAYVATSNNSGDTWLREFDRATGAVGFKVAFGSQWEHYWSPIVVGTTVYADGGSYGGLYGFDANVGTQVFFNGSIGQYDSWSPAFLGTTVYTFIAGNVRSHDRWTGAVLGTLNVGWTWNGYSMNTAPAFGGTYGYVISPPNLIAFDPATMTQVWTVNGQFTAYPAVAGGILYAISNGNLVALDASTGARKWLFVGDDHLAYPPVIAAGYIYVASNANVFAIDASTHQQVWTAPVGGRLAIGSGMLFVSRVSDGSLVAFQLTP